MSISERVATAVDDSWETASFLLGEGSELMAAQSGPRSIPRLSAGLHSHMAAGPICAVLAELGRRGQTAIVCLSVTARVAPRA